MLRAVTPSPWQKARGEWLARRMKMKRPQPLPLCLLAAVALVLPVGSASAARTPPAIRFTYRGGPLLTHVRVVNLFWGPGWSGTKLPDYFDSFFRDLFADGRFMANL